MPRIKYNRNNTNKRMDDNIDIIIDNDITVVDVYDIASEIGKECERIIDQYGADAVTSLMPRVINALELLEQLATKNERENQQLNELKYKIKQLENDKLEKAEYRKRFEKELEQIEEQWRNETKELLTMVTRLQEENRRLLKDISPSKQLKYSDDQYNNSSSNSSCDHDSGDILQKLKTTLEKQRDELRLKEKLLQEKCCDIDNLRSQVERLTGTSKDLRRKHKTFQNQVRSLCEERADFLVQLQDQQRDISNLRQQLGLAQKENEDLVNYDPPFPSNKAVYDLDDPNRPRFTTQELKDILNERNELKARVSDLEDELETYRPKEPLPKQQQQQQQQEEEAPVQGPLPYEPDDAPWKKATDSGIRKFFRKIFSETGSTGGSNSFPRRSLSTLSKMALSATTSSTTTTNEPIAV